MKRIIIGLTIIILGTAILATILYSVFVDSNFVFSWWDKVKALVGIESTEQIVEIQENNIVDNNQEQAEKTPTKIIAENNKEDEPQEIVNKPVDQLLEKRIQASSEKDTLLRMSRSFAERFGSYSNHSNFSNIETLKVFMTKEMQNWANQYVVEAKKVPRDDETYYGITTKAVSEEFLTYDDDLGEAQVLVITRRKEAVGSTQNQSESYTQDVEIHLEKENGLWKVSGAYWME